MLAMAWDGHSEARAYALAGHPHPRPLWMSAAGIAAALLLHAVLLSVFTLGTSAGKRPQHPGDMSSAIPVERDDGRLVSVLFYFDPRTLASEQGMSLPRTASRPLRSSELLKPRLIRLASLPGKLSDGQSAESQSQEATAATPVDGAERALLFGRYVNQITARIERAWVRPQSTPSGTPLWPSTTSGSSPSKGGKRFECRVQIVQSRAGEVLEVTLLDCDSSPEWQLSLVKAINAASPLPAPPSGAVFARMLVMNFSSAGGSSDSASPAAATPE